MIIHEIRECSVRIIEESKEDIVVNKPAVAPSSGTGSVESKLVRCDLNDTNSTVFSLTINSTF